MRPFLPEVERWHCSKKSRQSPKLLQNTFYLAKITSYRKPVGLQKKFGSNSKQELKLCSFHLIRSSKLATAEDVVQLPKFHVMWETWKADAGNLNRRSQFKPKVEMRPFLRMYTEKLAKIVRHLKKSI